MFFRVCILLAALVACAVQAAPGLLAPAPLAAVAAAPVAYAPAPAVVTAHSSQVVAQRFNGLAAPLVAAAYAAPAYPAYAAYAHAPVLLK
ncbi:vitelline membrane protein Vm26Ab-like [Periplaneta americana]|uniref:vitelline membrane protein Vm26Ab-like n=1 Tax=Periplaneta americana TaxID=6978 RepID=UPI0037E7C564